MHTAGRKYKRLQLAWRNMKFACAAMAVAAMGKGQLPTIIPFTVPI